MSESFFGLRKRPFASLPDPECFVPLAGICNAYDGLVQTATEGRGIGVLTAPAGLGKTLVCQRLARELAADFRIVFLPSGNFLTRRELLQAILFELGHSFVRMGDQELRLAMSTTLAAIRPDHIGLVLIVDEAHLLAARLLEELRTLLSLGEAGEPLVRLIVSGQLALEETLSRPQCDAFNQRIACQAMLPALTREESSSYLSRRLAWAGANVSEVFTRDSLTAICEAADGVPRCLHQLADHSLTLAANRGERPITLRTVREALDYLKQLPLTWAEPTVGRGAPNPLEVARAQAALATGTSRDVAEFVVRRPNAAEKSKREPLDDALFETYPLQAEQAKADIEETSQTPESAWEFDSAPQFVSAHSAHEAPDRFEEVEATRDAFTGIDDSEIEALVALRPVETTVSRALEFDEAPEIGTPIQSELKPLADDEGEEAGVEQKRLASVAGSAMTTVDEEVVIDRYAALDSAFNRLTRTMLNVQANARRKAAESTAASILSNGPSPLSTEPVDASPQRFDIVLPEDDPVGEQTTANDAVNRTKSLLPAITKHIAHQADTQPIREPAGVPTAAATAGIAAAPVAREAVRSTTDERRPYQLLFSELRRQRRRV
jgi:type II secretory pathway predicted ATPase ExeA